MANILALYRGETLGSARLVAVSTDPDLVARFADELLDHGADSRDPVAAAVEEGRRTALRLVRDEAEG